MKRRAIGSAGLLINPNGLNVYVDPGGFEEEQPRADIVVLSAGEPGLLPMREVRRLASPQTIVVGLPQCVSQFRLNQLPIHPGQTRSVLGVHIEASEGKGGGLSFRLRSGNREIRYPEGN